MIPLREKYTTEVVPAMMKKFGYTHTMAVPRLVKVTLNSGFGKLAAGKSTDEQTKIGEEVAKDLTLIAGQRAILTKAKKSIASFKSRKGQPLGVKVSLRGRKMYDFLDRLIHIVFPRSRDFRGLSAAAVDNTGNMTIGIKEHIFFPEVSPEKVRSIFGLEICISTTAATREEGQELMRLLGLPLK